MSREAAHRTTRELVSGCAEALVRRERRYIEVRSAPPQRHLIRGPCTRRQFRTRTDPAEGRSDERRGRARHPDVATSPASDQASIRCWPTRQSSSQRSWQRVGTHPSVGWRQRSRAELQRADTLDRPYPPSVPSHACDPLRAPSSAPPRALSELCDAARVHRNIDRVRDLASRVLARRRPRSDRDPAANEGRADRAPLAHLLEHRAQRSLLGSRQSR